MSPPLYANKPMLFFRSDEHEKFKKIAAAVASLAVMAATTMSLSGSAVTTVRDPDGDGRILVSDGSFILQYLAGNFNPTSQRSLDFDGNSIISNKDATVLAHYWMKLINGSSLDDINLPAPVGADSQGVATTRQYVRHYYSNVTNPVTEYSLTVDACDNTNTSPNASSQQRVIIGENDKKKDSDTSVVNLINIGKGYGTGFIVDKHIIATAAHCVCKDQSFNNTAIKLTDSENNIKMIFPKYIDVNKNFYDNYISNNLNTNYLNYLINYDYALIYVEEDLTNYGIFKMGVALNGYTNNHGEVTVSGFPRADDYPDEYKGTSYGKRFKATGKILNHSTSYFAYDADTAHGDSGGPVYVQEEFSGDKYNTVIAINVAGYSDPEDPTNDDLKENYGVRITPNILKFFYNNPNIN